MQPTILDLAKFVAQQDPRRIDKPLFAQPGSPPGEVHLLRFQDYTNEAAGVTTIADWLANVQAIPPDQTLVMPETTLGGALKPAAAGQ